MAGLTALAVALGKIRQVAQQAAAAVLLLESLAVSGFAIRFLSQGLAGAGDGTASSPLWLWLPAVAGMALAAVAVSFRSSITPSRPAARAGKP